MHLDYFALQVEVFNMSFELGTDQVHLGHVFSVRPNFRVLTCMVHVRLVFVFCSIIFRVQIVCGLTDLDPH